MNENQIKILKLAEKKDLSKMKYREIARELNIDNPQTVIYHIEQLKKRGLIYFDGRQNKNKVAKEGAFVLKDLFSLPIVGSANCGDALELAQENILGRLRISARILGRSKPSGLFVIKAIGDSLNKAGINGNSVEDGDYVVIDRNKQPKNGDYVLSVIGGSANLKRFFKDDKNKEIRLISESTSDIPPIIIHEDDLNTSEYLVNGVVLKVIKN